MRHAIIILFLIFSQTLAQAQILEKYPLGQFFYERGELNFFKELQNVAKANNQKKCENNLDYYKLFFVVYPDKTIRFVKDPNTNIKEQNQCAFDFIKNTFKHLNNWNPAFVNGKAYPAMVELDIYPADVLQFQIADDLTLGFQKAEYRGGYKKLHTDIEYIVQKTMSRYRINLDGQTVRVSFIVSKIGKMKDFKFSSEIPFNVADDLIRDLEKLPNWKPATKNGVNVESNYTMPMTFGYPISPF